MMVSHSHKFAFFHIPKTGGTSIEAMLFPYCEIQQRMHRGVYKDVTLDTPNFQAYAHVDAHHSVPFDAVRSNVADITGYFTFTFVRNPWDRVLSLYFSMRGDRATIAPDDINAGVLRDINTFYPNHQRSFLQVNFFEPEGWENFYSRVCRFENFDEECAWLTNHLGLGTLEVPRKNVSNKKGIRYQDVFTDATARRVADFFAEDIAMFGYTYE